MTEQSLDVVVVGGGPAGLSAALILGRMRRRVLLLDTDAPANAVSKAMHGFLSRDGTPPAEVRRVAVEQLEPYETVECRTVAARSAGRVSGGFEIALDDGSHVTTRRLLLAHGMRYGLPHLDGVSELWGERIFHCPYCHGWEVRDRPIAVYGCGEKSVHQALLLSALSDDVVLLCDGDSEIAAEQRERLDLAGVELVDDQVERVEETGERAPRRVHHGPALAGPACAVHPAGLVAHKRSSGFARRGADRDRKRRDRRRRTELGSRPLRRR